MNDSAAKSAPTERGQVNWASVSTVLSAAIMIGAEVFGAAYAAGWAFAGLFGLDYYLGSYAPYILQAILFALGIYVMGVFVRNAMRVEPFVRRN
ncbi:MAG: hypothetical protein ACRECO_20770 [Xanthobacteraceae bacterium]